MSWKGNVLKPVMKNNTAKWKKELNTTQVAKIEGGIENVMKQLGYELSESSSWFAKNVLSFPIKMAAMAFKFKGNKEAVKQNG